MTRKTTKLMITLTAILMIAPLIMNVDAITTPPIVHLTCDNTSHTNPSDFGSRAGTTTTIGVLEYRASPLINSCYFDETNDHIDLSDESDFDFTNTDDFSVAFWVKVDGTETGGNDIMVSKGADLLNVGWYVHTNDNDIVRFEIDDGSSNNHVISTTTITDDEWYHVTVTYDGSSNQSGMKIYINGSLDATGIGNTIVGFLNNNVVVIGDDDNGSNRFKGDLDDIRIYDYALTSDQVQDLYRFNPLIHTELLEAIEDLQSQITSINGTVQDNVAEIDDLYDFWDDLRASIITWLAGRP
ncbi:LamG domain-containing protein [Nitrosopumilus piranensis]|uniref:LamG-like jellyroll fold domain-containing protein n=1 Tax=Nitrosopumilus piranensis TaxID=1582439 RepID=A0A0C5BYY2_9ARCH|nr:LamG domain-containing protein [Nitrosopumilus piranensis]AJM92200.1 exported protein of unknown function [Nitrosopumilus piranensis]